MSSELKLTLAHLQQAMMCQLQSGAEHALIMSREIHTVVTDSRKIIPGCLFVALRGESFDAHDFLADVAKSGAAAVVVEHVPANFPLPAFIVPNTLHALAEIALYWRKRFTLPVIAVTGSNGKTTVKEMISAILNAAYGEGFYLSTKGNLNNEIGVPQTIYRLTNQHAAAVLELGMNHPGEIARLAAMALPTVGLVNNAQREHQEFMQSVAAVAEENGAVILSLPEDGVAVFPAGDAYSDLWRSYAGQRKVLTFGLLNPQVPADISASYQASEFGNDMQIHIGKEQLSVQLAAAGLHNVLNALAAAASCHAIGCSATAIFNGLKNFTPVSGRLQKKQAANLATIIDDTYNANPDSVRAAIDVLAQAGGQKILVLGDMGEVGESGPAYHQEIGLYAQQQGIDILLTLGELASSSSAVFGARAQHFNTTESLLQHLDGCVPSTATVLIKGSRFMKMERVVAYLTARI